MCGVLLAARMGLKQLVQDAGEFESISGTEHREEVLSLCAALLPYSAVQFSAGLGQSDLNGTPVIRIGAARHQILRPRRCRPRVANPQVSIGFGGLSAPVSGASAAGLEVPPQGARFGARFLASARNDALLGGGF